MGFNGRSGGLTVISRRAFLKTELRTHLMCFCDVGSRTFFVFGFAFVQQWCMNRWPCHKRPNMSHSLMSCANKTEKWRGTEKNMVADNSQVTCLPCFGSKPCSCHLLNVRGKKSPLIPMSSDRNIRFHNFTVLQMWLENGRSKLHSVSCTIGRLKPQNSAYTVKCKMGRSKFHSTYLIIIYTITPCKMEGRCFHMLQIYANIMSKMLEIHATWKLPSPKSCKCQAETTTSTVQLCTTIYNYYNDSNCNRHNCNYNWHKSTNNKQQPTSNNQPTNNSQKPTINNQQQL